MRTRVAALSVVILVVHGAAVAAAATISFSFSGSAETVSSFLAATFDPGDTLAGTFELDPLATVASCHGFTRCYSSSMQPLSATLGSYTFSGNISPAVSDVIASTWIALAEPPNPIAETDLIGPPVNGLPIRVFRITLIDPSGTALDGDALVQPVFDDYSVRYFELEFDAARNADGSIVFPKVMGPLTGLGPTPVPEPATALLFVTGALALCSRRLVGGETPKSSS